MIPDASTPSAAESTTSVPLQSLSAALPLVGQPKSAVAKLVLRPHPPIRAPPDVAAWSRLQQINEIQVLPISGSPNQEPQYAIRVLLRHSQSLTTTIYNRASDTAADKPELLVLRRFSEFETLRTQVWDAVRYPHHRFCELCDGLTQLMLTKLMVSSVLTKTIHRSQASRAKKMRKYLLRVLSELCENKPLCVSMCRGQHELPLVLHGFLFHDEEAEAACAAAAAPSESTALRS